MLAIKKFMTKSIDFIVSIFKDSIKMHLHCDSIYA